MDATADLVFLDPAYPESAKVACTRHMRTAACGIIEAIDFDDTEHVSLDARFLAEGKGTGILRGTQMGNHPVVIHDDAVDLVL
jgi:hypothetical protein